jgi:bacillolysin
VKATCRKVLAASLLLAASLTAPAQAGPPPPGSSDAPLVEQLNRESQGILRISYHAETGKVRFIGASPARPIPQPTLLAAGASPEMAARGFLAVYGQLFGLRDEAQELTVMEERLADDGRSFVRFQQVYRGMPVMGGELIVQMDAGKNVVSANGEVLPDLVLDPTPKINASRAKQTALRLVAKYHQLELDELTASEPELWIYNPALLGGPGLRVSTLVWRMEVTAVELLPIRELVLVDAQRGSVALHFNQVDTARNRHIYDNQNNPFYGLPGLGPVRSEDGGATGVVDADKAYDYAGDTYDFYYTHHGRDSIDDAGMSLISTVRYCPNSSYCPYENAFWNGSQMVYGAGFSRADDVVAHELTHGVTEYEANLFYYMQSGAINEAFSDIWGEFVDLTNGAGNDSPDVRWQMGEDEPNYETVRDMKNPPLYSQPDKMTSTYYACLDGGWDSGGVHTNSGVANKAAYLMTDGESFNNYTITGIGIAKTARIWYEVQTNMFTSASDYQDLYDALPQACYNLAGSGGITLHDCQQVQAAVDATEMNQQPAGCPAQHAPTCDSGSPHYLFTDDFEAGVGNWTSGAYQGNDEWWYENRYATSGFWHLWGWDQGAWVGEEPLTADYWAAMTTDVALPAGSDPFLHFKHAYGFENDWLSYYDGGVVEYSTNGGASWNDANLLFTHNGYNGTISSCCGNPLAGRSGFVAESYGYYSSRLDLSPLAGQNVRFRFRIGTDGYVDDYGWFIDDVLIYTCTTNNTAPRFLNSGLPDQRVPTNGHRDNAIDLWWYVDDNESDDSQLTFNFCNAPDPNAGVTIDSERFIDINPVTGWTGSTDVCVRAKDPGELSSTATFKVSVGPSIYLPLILRNAR